MISLFNGLLIERLGSVELAPIGFRNPLGTSLPVDFIFHRRGKRRVMIVLVLKLVADLRTSSDDGESGSISDRGVRIEGFNSVKTPDCWKLNEAESSLGAWLVKGFLDIVSNNKEIVALRYRQEPSSEQLYVGLVLDEHEAIREPLNWIARKIIPLLSRYRPG